MLEFRSHHSIREIAEADWDNLVGPSEVPYLRWTFLEALEATECAHPDAGWGPAHVGLYEDDELVGAAPCYVKGNSDGEFVFDHSWAQFAYQRLDHDYYPKLIVACPFTPATGPRLIYRRGADVTLLSKGLAEGLCRFVEKLELSGAHVLFPDETQASALEDAGLMRRYGLQYHWRNAGYGCFDDFLARYNSKRRHQIRRERRELEAQGIELRTFTGSDLTPEVIDHAYQFYRSTVDKYYFGRRYLNRQFFEEVCARLPSQVMVVLAYEKSTSRYIAGAFNLIGAKRLFGRYWGCHAELRYLHFNVCYYRGIEECIERKLEVFEPGAGGEHKVVRGFEPTLTYSNHYLRQPVMRSAISDFLVREKQAIDEQIAEHKPLLKPYSCVD